MNTTTRVPDEVAAATVCVIAPVEPKEVLLPKFVTAISLPARLSYEADILSDRART